MIISHLRLIEIELFSYCNRMCAWCPNKTINRIKDIQFLDNDIFVSLIKELQSCNYNHAISFSRYNEPMSYIDEFKAAVAYIKQQLPGAPLVTNTNGDFLCEKNFDGLLIDQLTIMDYDNKGLGKGIQQLLECNCEIININYPYIRAKRKDMDIIYYVDWPRHARISDRGGSIPQYSMMNRRTAPCYEPMYFIGVNYDGTISPCCNIRNDIKSQQDYIFGDLHTNSLSDILNTETYQQFVEACQCGSFKEGSCEYCSNGGGRYTREEGGIEYE